MSENPEPAKKDGFSIDKAASFFAFWAPSLLTVWYLNEKNRFMPDLPGSFSIPPLVLIVSFFLAWLGQFAYLHYFQEMGRKEATEEAKTRAGHAVAAAIVIAIASAVLGGLTSKGG